MPSTEYLKQSYQSRLYVVLAINLAAFSVVIISDGDFSTLRNLLNSVSIQDGVVGLTAPIAAFILDGLLSADTKARIVYCRYHHPLPGSRAFSVHLLQEPRADPRRLARHWGALPADPVAQNRLWYRIFRSVEDEVRVREAHRAWLFARDLSAYAALFLIIFGIATLTAGSQWVVASWYLVSLATQLAASMAAARTYGVRFVRTVLAVASQNLVDEPEARA